MHITFLNIHGNFDPQDRYWTAHPDFGGQLVYVKEVTLALGHMGHKIDIITRRIKDPQWPGFDGMFDAYPGEPCVRIIRLPCGGDQFLNKPELWPYIGTEWVPNIKAFYANEGSAPDIVTAHYGDSGLAAALWHDQGGPPFTFTAHSLGAQKLERLFVYNHTSLTELDTEYHFARRIAAERVAINHARRLITSTHQERMSQYGHSAYQSAVDIEDGEKFSVIPPGVNLHIFDAGVQGPDDKRIAGRIDQVLERDIAPERLDLPVVICSSRLERKKNHIGLVMAFARNPELQASANLMLSVRGTENIRNGMALKDEEKILMDEIVQACETYALWGKVSGLSLESQSELAAAYRYLANRRSVFALTAMYEPFGLAPLEAAAAGLPVVVTQSGGPIESLLDAESNTEYGVLVDPTDPASIAQGICRLVGKDNEWERFRDAGRRRVLDRYTWDHTANGYLDVVRAILTEIPPEAGELLPIPRYFTEPTPDNDLSLDDLKNLFQRES
jgi:sucrose-phosphate synthase